MSENILTQIKSQYRFFTKVEKKLADIILSNPHKFVTFSTATVAKLAGVSQGSVNNFAKKFCDEGFSFLKLQIAHCVSKQDEDFIQSAPKPESKKFLSFMERKARQDISALCHTLEINVEESLKSAIKLISDSGRIEIIGVRQSGFVSEEFAYMLKKYGKNANAVSNPILFPITVSNLCEDSLLIVISSSGQTDSVLEAVRIAKEKGAKILVITSNRFSDLVKLSSVSLFTCAGNGKNDGYSDRIRMSAFLLIDTICYYFEIFKLYKER